jgi:hypothetical protein
LPGFDPAIHFEVAKEGMDARIKSGHDDEGGAALP